LEIYRDHLGGEVAHEFRNEAGELYGAFIHHGDGTFVELFREVDAAGNHRGRFRHLAFEVEDIEAAAASLRQRGYAPTVRRGRTDKVLQLFVTDRDGNGIELQQHDRQSALTQFLSRRMRPRRGPVIWALLAAILAALLLADVALRVVAPGYDPDRQLRMTEGIG
jgi:catechol 2,3-dioxygenase-like lactoylglutathione lyase family enzyme